MISDSEFGPERDHLLVDMKPDRVPGFTGEMESGFNAESPQNSILDELLLKVNNVVELNTGISLKTA